MTRRIDPPFKKLSYLVAPTDDAAPMAGASEAKKKRKICDGSARKLYYVILDGL